MIHEEKVDKYILKFRYVNNMLLDFNGLVSDIFIESARTALINYVNVFDVTPPFHGYKMVASIEKRVQSFRL